MPCRETCTPVSRQGTLEKIGTELTYVVPKEGLCAKPECARDNFAPTIWARRSRRESAMYRFKARTVLTRDARSFCSTRLRCMLFPKDYMLGSSNLGHIDVINRSQSARSAPDGRPKVGGMLCVSALACLVGCGCGSPASGCKSPVGPLSLTAQCRLYDFNVLCTSGTLQVATCCKCPEGHGTAPNLG